jgi:hypothetical protein
MPMSAQIAFIAIIFLIIVDHLLSSFLKSWYYTSGINISELQIDSSIVRAILDNKTTLNSGLRMNKISEQMVAVIEENSIAYLRVSASALDTAAF